MEAKDIGPVIFEVGLALLHKECLEEFVEQLSVRIESLGVIPDDCRSIYSSLGVRGVQHPGSRKPWQSLLRGLPLVVIRADFFQQGRKQCGMLTRVGPGPEHVTRWAMTETRRKIPKIGGVYLIDRTVHCRSSRRDAPQLPRLEFLKLFRVHRR